MFLILSLIFVTLTYPPISCGENGTTVPTNSSNNATVNKINLTLSSEGGSLLTKNPSISLLSENEAKAIEAGSVSIKKNKIQARKGAPNNTSAEDTSSNFVEEKFTTSNNLTVLGATNDTKLKDDTKKAPEIKEDTKTFVKVNSSQDGMNKTVKENLKKPLILSYDALANDGQLGSKMPKFPASKASSKTLVSDQMPSPNNDTPKTVHVGVSGRNPGMVVPIVITILVVPVFAILGYLALKRGQEAWKNRHYKRMDFLLDGMYND